MSDILAELERSIAGLPPDERAQVEAMVAEELKQVWLPNAGPQAAAYDSEADLLLYGGAAGGGKGLRPSTPVLTPFGWREIGKLEAGDAICATDGTITKVIAVYHRGVQPLFRLTFADGSQIECDSDHIWQGWVAGRGRKIGNERVFGEAAVRKWVTSDLFAHYGSGVGRVIVPVMSAPAAFNVAGQLVGPKTFAKRELPPYVLGVLIGDGSLSGLSAIFCKPDREVAERVERELGCQLSVYDGDGGAPTYRIPNAYAVEQLSQLGLMGCKSAEKFIPRIYLFGTVAERFDLLQGLMDTDGWADEDGDIYYCTVSLQLAGDVRHLARSLGAIVTTSEKHPQYTHNGEKRQGQKAYALRIKMVAPERAFSLPRKRDRAVGKTYQSMGLALEGIEPAGEGETVCIAVEHPNSLFVTEHFLVTHNTDLLCGTAFTRHQRSVIFREQYTDLRGLEERSIEIMGSRTGYNGADMIWRHDGRIVEFGAIGKPGSERSWQGRPHDFIGFDEGAQLQVDKVRFVMNWLRSTVPGQRCRIIIATNPPTGPEGQWLMEWFAPWLDPMFANPAKPGELRYAVIAPDNRIIWADGPGHIVLLDTGGWRVATAEEIAQEDERDDILKPLSRTFIPSRLEDNPYLKGTGYRAQLQSAPEPLRSILLKGDFLAGRKDHEWQVIPSEWIRAAQARWKPPETPMIAIAADPAQGGDDNTALAPLHIGNVFGVIHSRPGKETPEPPDVANLILKLRKDGAAIAIDCTGGWGGGARSHLRTHHQIEAGAIVFSAEGVGNDPGSGLKYFNLRAKLYWEMRLALDPHGQERVALPPGERIVAQLSAPRWTPRGNAILIESKDEIRARLGSSPDEADAIVMAWNIRRLGLQQRMQAPVRVNLGHSHLKSTAGNRSDETIRVNLRRPN